MAHPFILLQLSDPHVGADWGGRDPVERLRAAVAEALALPDRFDAVLVSGDLADNGRPEEYAAVRAELERLGAPYYVLPGNHDRRAALREAFGLGGEPDDPVEYDADLGPLRLVVADTVVPGEDRGSLDDARLGRLESLLALAPEQPTIFALHHPPLATGIAAWDAINLSAADRAGLAEIVSRAPQLRAIVGGHVHRAMAAALAGVPVLAVPSVYAQVAPVFDLDEAPQINAEPPAFALHVLRDGELSSQVVPYYLA